MLMMANAISMELLSVMELGTDHMILLVVVSLGTAMYISH